MAKRLTATRLRQLVLAEVKKARRINEAPGSAEPMIVRLLNEAITLLDRASMLASEGGLDDEQAARLSDIEDELRTFVLDLGGGDDTY